MKNKSVIEYMTESDEYNQAEPMTERVNQLLAEGWELYGPTVFLLDCRDSLRRCQALVRRKSAKGSCEGCPDWDGIECPMKPESHPCQQNPTYLQDCKKSEETLHGKTYKTIVFGKGITNDFKFSDFEDALYLSNESFEQIPSHLVEMADLVIEVCEGGKLLYHKKKY